MGLGHIKTFMDASITWSSAVFRYVALGMAYHADSKGIVRISQTELAEELLLSTKTVSRAIDDLCDAEIYVRLGHGRYGIRFGLSVNESQTLPSPKGAEREYTRLRSIRQPNQGIAYRSDGWPVLAERKA